MAQDHAGHAVVGDPVHAERRIDLGPEIDGEEAVALQPARRHQDEDAEGRVGEAEPCGAGSAKSPTTVSTLSMSPIDVAQMRTDSGSRQNPPSA